MNAYTFIDYPIYTIIVHDLYVNYRTCRLKRWTIWGVHIR
jgi:hypothetical protein